MSLIWVATKKQESQVPDKFRKYFCNACLHLVLTSFLDNPTQSGHLSEVVATHFDFADHSLRQFDQDVFNCMVTPCVKSNLPWSPEMDVSTRYKQDHRVVSYLEHAVDVHWQCKANIVIWVAICGTGHHGTHWRGALQGGLTDRAQKILLIQRCKTQSLEKPVLIQMGRDQREAFGRRTTLGERKESLDNLETTCDDTALL